MGTGDTSTEIEASTEHPYATIAVGLELSYSGSLSTAAEKDVAWHASSADVTISISDTSVAYNAETAPNGVRSGEGLKFKKDSAFVQTTGGYAGESVSWTVAKSVLDTMNFSGPNLTKAVGTLYVAAKGVDGLAQVNTTQYKVTASIAAA